MERSTPINQPEDIISINDSLNSLPSVPIPKTKAKPRSKTIEYQNIKEKCLDQGILPDQSVIQDYYDIHGESLPPKLIDLYNQVVDELNENRVKKRGVRKHKYYATAFSDIPWQEPQLSKAGREEPRLPKAKKVSKGTKRTFEEVFETPYKDMYSSEGPSKGKEHEHYKQTGNSERNQGDDSNTKNPPRGTGREQLKSSKRKGQKAKRNLEGPISEEWEVRKLTTVGNRTQRQTYGEISRRMDIAVQKTFNKNPKESLSIMHRWLRHEFLDLSKYQLPTICTEEAEAAQYPIIESKHAGTVVSTDLKLFVLYDLRHGGVVPLGPPVVKVQPA
ncbi:hypothetical protein OIDMADRAFT_35563 [Oidiodendron maius Zn]|uniref:Uncharacterized protein n=1 Tax=Oidiodendron maius (strain Zn) TaxID=913774 RepID=A0A0C3C4C5_OIDMZ|nr:hypothetical protein OIDMADRAFT_35563 [Oidiodendron maius Zn]